MRGFTVGQTYFRECRRKLGITCQRMMMGGLMTYNYNANDEELIK